MTNAVLSKKSNAGKEFAQSIVWVMTFTLILFFGSFSTLAAEHDGIQVAVASIAPMRVSATFEAAESGRTLYVVYGDKDYGASYNWPNRADLCVVPAGATSVNDVALPDGIGKRFSRFRLTFAPETESTDYLQTDLVAQWDAIDNAGRNAHDETSVNWKDLVGSRDIPATGLTFEDGRVVFPAGVTPSVDASALRGKVKTVEVVCRIDDAFASSGKSTCVFNLCNDVQLAFRNDSTGCYIQPHFRRCSDNNVFWFWPESSDKYNTKQQPVRADSYSLYNALDPGDSRFYVQTELVARHGWYYNEVQAQNDLLALGHANAKSYVSSIRIYSRALTDAERADNYTVDVRRYLTDYASSACQVVDVPFSVTCRESGESLVVDLVFMPTNINRRLSIAFGKDQGRTTEGWKRFQFLQDVAPGVSSIEGLTVPAEAVASSGFRFFLIDGYKSSDYLQTDLIAQWDAVDNAGHDTHSATPEVWKDLIGSRDISATGLIFGADKVDCPSGVTPSVDVSAYKGKVKTVEIVCCTESAFSSSGLSATAFNLCNDLRLVFGNTASGIYVQPIYNRFQDNNVFYAWTNDAKYNTKIQPTVLDSYSLYNATDPSESYCYVENEKLQSGGWYYNAVQAQNDNLTLGTANVKFIYSSIRIYSRALTADERAANYEVDRSRYLGAAVILATDYVKIPHGVILVVR